VSSNLGAFINLTNQRFGKLTVIKRIGTKRGCALWLCLCDCGKATKIPTNLLRNGNTQSCGCIHSQQLIARNKVTAKHGYSDKERLYNIWHSMRQRCLDSNRKDYHRYGGRGISICCEWNDYKIFRDWAMANSYSDKLSIDRINVNGNYCPENCRWVDAKTQANNRSTENVRRNTNGTYKRAN
jgi:hypothetical protein